MKRLHKTRLIGKDSNILAITLFGHVFTRYPERINKYVMNHELIHCRQQRELLYLPFFIIYGVEWLIKRFKYGNWQLAYRNISFEKEAYANDRDLHYLNSRHLFGQWRRSNPLRYGGHRQPFR